MAKKIYIRVGHGGTDPGATLGSRTEADDNLRMAKEVKIILESAGHTVKLSRTSNGTAKPSISAIVAEANAWGADYFLDIHRNSVRGTASDTATGSECLIRSSSSAASRDLAQDILNRICKVGGANRGVKVQDTNTGSLVGNMPGTIIELLFISNPNDNKLYDSKFNDYAKAITQGVCDVAGGTIGGGSMNGWKQSGTNWNYYVNGVKKKSYWVPKNDKGEEYYLGADGNMVTNAFVLSADGKKAYWVDKNGVWDGVIYILGVAKLGIFIGGSQCLCTDKNGKCNGKLYYVVK
jgi:N-acetylmuramoyl-L-alanine amidase